MIEIKGKYNEAKIFTDVVASPSASSGWPMKKASAISEKRLWTPLQKSFWIRIIPGTTVPVSYTHLLIDWIQNRRHDKCISKNTGATLSEARTTF